MLIPKKNRQDIYECLFKDGCMVAKKDFNAPKHPDLEHVPNLQVINAMKVNVSFCFIEVRLIVRTLIHVSFNGDS